MDRILTIIIVFWITMTSEDAETAIFSLQESGGEDTNPTEGNAKLCRLPPYPKHGGYVALGEKDAGPGDVFSNVSLVRYTTQRDSQVFEVRRLTCSSGEWEQDVFEFDGKALYFYTAWCPYFCTSYLSEQWTECPPPNIEKNPKAGPQSRPLGVTKRPESNNTKSQPCRLPPYPSRGTYLVQDKPDAGPGDSFQNVSFIQYTSDDSNGIVTIEHFRCTSGMWYQKIFQEASEILYFYTSWCPSLCSQCFGEKLTGRQRIPSSKIQTSRNKNQPKIKGISCVLPRYPEFGNYSLISESRVREPGEEYDAFRLNYTCGSGYTLTASGSVSCLRGVWSGELPRCTKPCRLIHQPSVEYFCGDESSSDELRPCGESVEDGSVVTPRCRSPYYRSMSPLRPMTCEHGEWDNTSDCRPVCGLRVEAEGRPTVDARVRAPWHVAIFNKEYQSLKCGGSIVAHNLVISVANCFSSLFSNAIGIVDSVVVAGKLYRSWYQPNDDMTQWSEISSIKTSPWHTGVFSSYQHDIALLFLDKPFVFNEYVWPVCLNFDNDLDEMQLTEGRLGIVAGWGRSDRGSSDVLRIVELPYIDVHKCIIKAMNTKSRYGEEQQITSDKICAGNDTGVPLCKEDQGGGFAMAQIDPLDPRKSYYYLRGIVSLYNNNLCNEVTFSVFTKVSAHENFIKSNSAGVIF